MTTIWALVISNVFIEETRDFCNSASIHDTNIKNEVNILNYSLRR